MPTRLDNASRLAILHHLCGAIAQCDAIPRVATCIDEVLRSALQFEQVYILLKEPILGHVRLYSASQSACIEEAARKFGLSEGFIQYLCHATAQSEATDLLAEPRANASCILVPLITKKRKLGMLLLMRRPSACITSEDTLFLQEVGLLIAPLLEDLWRTPPQLKNCDKGFSKERNRLRVLLDVNNAVAKTLSFRDLLHEVAQILRPAGGADSYALVLHDSYSKVFRWVALDLESGAESKYLGTISPIDYGYPTSAAFASQKPVLLDGVQFTRLANRNGRGTESRIWTNERALATVAVPLLAHGKMLGIFDVSYNHRGTYAPGNEHLITDMSSQLSIAVENILSAQEIAKLTSAGSERQHYLVPGIRRADPVFEFIGESRVVRELMAQVENVASTDATVLICGETGTGKELVARAIHCLSARRSQPLVEVNCAAIPAQLLESEFFGHEKGSFTGANAQTVGRLEQAHNGTLFLDEIGEMPLELQPKLLRALQERKFERVGGTRSIQVNVRFIAATNQHLKQRMLDHQFRSDLYYRLNVFPIVIPPLRERREDIPLLVAHFVNKYAAQVGKTIESVPKETMNMLERAQWPGNVRELANVIERAVILSPSSVLRVSALYLEEMDWGSPALPSYERPRSASDANLQEIEREHILKILRENKGFISKAAIRLGMKRTTLNSRLQRLGITTPDLIELRRTLRTR
ncbi:MAG TPA: sigma 54-interacting transcriptional regulator [Candidatus Saccharimonadales bacterium]|nr:sigma 54-interacting transcriptional regulator [Candidatus Saccharimonadales bacterium]